MKKLVLIFSILLLITGCNSKGKANEVNVLNWSSYIPDSVVRNFEKETGIKVNYSTYSSNEECLAKVSSAKEGTYDLIFPSDYMIEIMVERKMLETIKWYELKNINNINEIYLNQSYDPKNEYSLPFVVASTVLAVNRDNVKEEITSYKDLLNEKFKNNITLIDDQRIIIGVGLLANGFDMNSTNVNELEIAKNWLLKLKENVKAFDSDSPKNFLITEESDIALLWNAEAALAYQDNNNIEIIYPEEGTAISIDNFAIPKGAKNESNAYKFIDYILRADVMKEIIDSYPYKNVNKETDLLLDDSYLNNIASNIPDVYFNKGIFVKNVGSFIKNYDKVWAEIK